MCSCKKEIPYYSNDVRYARYACFVFKNWAASGIRFDVKYLCAQSIEYRSPCKRWFLPCLFPVNYSRPWPQPIKINSMTSFSCIFETFKKFLVQLFVFFCRTDFVVETAVGCSGFLNDNILLFHPSLHHWTIDIKVKRHSTIRYLRFPSSVNDLGKKEGQIS